MTYDLTYTPPTGTFPASMTGAQDRALRDTLEAERAMRDRSEENVRDLVRLLAELAYRFDGQGLEDARREDPRGQATWTVKDWRNFFSSIRRKQPASGWGGKTDEKELLSLREEVANLKKLLGEALLAAERASQIPAKEKVKVITPEAQELAPLPPKPKMKTTSSQQVRGKKKTQPQKRSAETIAKVKARIAALGKAEEVSEGMVGSMASILLDLQTTLKGERFPKSPPAAWKQRLNGSGRKGRDLDLAYQRYWSVLWLSGRWGIVSKMEVETLIGLSNGLSSRSGALSRVMKDLLNAGVITEKSHRLSTAPSSALKIFQLSSEGQALFKLLFKKSAVQDELSVLYEKHEGERFPDHTLAVLIFALHARRRGWATQLMPSIEGKSAPDLVVQRSDERLYVEVERGQKEKKTKWTGIADLNDGTVALCAMTPKFRRRLVGDCKLAKIKKGFATDLKTLVTIKYDTIGAKTPLWEEKW
jgi:hypothetical protein